MHAVGAQARDEAGGVLPFVALTIGVIVIGASFAVDLGLLTNATRDMQKVADLAALDSAWQLDGSDTATIAPAVEAAALESAQRNDHTGPDDELVVTVGDWDPVAFEFTPTTGTEIPDAVRVEATTVHHNFLQPGDGQVTRAAVASRDTGSSSTTSSTTPTTVPSSSTPDSATFTAGSRLASVSTYQSSLLNDVFSDALGGGVHLTALDYQGLANASLTMTELGAHLSTAAGTPTEVADSVVTLDDLFSATASALTDQGDAAAAAVVTAMGSAGGSLETVSVRLGDVMGVASGGDAAAAVAELDVLGILTGTAFVADGDSFINLPSLTVAVSGVTSTTAGLRIVEGPRWASGPVGTSLSTSQLTLELDPTVNINLSYLRTGLRAVSTLATDTELAGLDVTLTALPCPGTTTDLTVDPRAAAATALSTTTVKQTILGITTDVLRMTADGTTTSDPPAQVLGWLDPDEVGTTRTVGSHTADLDAMDLTVTDTTVLGVLPLPLSSITSAVVSELETILAALDTAAVAQVSDLLGISFAGGDVTLDASQCGSTSEGSGGGSGGGSTGGTSGSTTPGTPELVA